MRTVKIDKDYLFPETWEDIRLDQAVDLFKVKVPEVLKTYWKQSLEEKPIDEFSFKDLNKTLPEYYGRVLCAWGVPLKVVKKIRMADRCFLYDSFFSDIILGLNYSPLYTPKGIEFIMCDKEKLYLPKDKSILGTKVPMAYESTWNFTEQADLVIYSKELEGGVYEVLANIASIMCRPMGEEYDEDVSLKRAETLKTMNMSDAWEVFFCLIKLCDMQLQQDLMFLNQKVMQNLRLPLKQRALVAGQELLSKWGKHLKGLKMSKKRIYGTSST